MSGGHFDHQQASLGCIAEQIEEDIQYNDIPWNQPIIKDDYEYSGHQFSSETIAFMKDTVKKLHDLEYVLQELDLAMSGDTCEETLKERLIDKK